MLLSKNVLTYARSAMQEENQDLGVVKPLRKERLRPPLDLSPNSGDRPLDK